MNKITLNTLEARKQQQEKFAVITAYDATFARLSDDAGIEVLLVGDSLGMVLQGHNSTLPVTLDDMVYHTRCVSQGNQNALILGDLPFGSYATTEQTLHSAAALMRAGAHAVKLEGGIWLEETIHALVTRGIPVCAHLGLTPQSVNIFGGYKVQGRSPEQAEQILNDAIGLQNAGASLLVLECVPRTLAAAITKALRIPVIGIGAGSDTDAQVLVLHDLLGLSARAPRFVRNFMIGADSIQQALQNYRQAVLNGEFPAAEHGFDA
jgi:3-methyl-2-oxobutanoate hydroxymethyltransferase